MEERTEKERVQRFRTFYYYTAFYISGTMFLTFINLIVSPSVLWFYWPLVIGGIVLAVYARSLRTKS